VRRALDALKADSDSGKAGSKVCFHPGPGIGSFGSSAGFAAPACLALGSERGWTEAETRLFQAEGFTLASLGTRILKTETAASAAAAIALARLGLI